ncbi:type II secretion system protein GspC [Shewanella amazonensis]|uniref:General secretion pathway protein C n=1 Tax=Shewanella amazonensis (strain ATCC BAA-1098 / SB2B) TaxID=326297 RepID=A1S1X3_SHEAM|nr:type II secretion system protein GspC [Shewanella amazonensis]ABL98379.1 general secretion pathway protein C [Shewanella amazonensis SB2B]
MDLLDKVIARAGSIPHKPLSRLVFWLAFAACCYLAAQISWRLVPAQTESAAWRPNPPSSGTNGNSGIDVDGLKSLSLFGKADTSKPKEQPVQEVITDAPKTSLSIVLTGIVASTAEQKGLAIIESGGSQETYELGEKIKGTSASLKEVYADRVIITNAGRYETLMLDGVPYTSGASTPTINNTRQRGFEDEVRRIDKRRDEDVAAELSSSRDELLADPSKITDYISISPVTQGEELVGYRLQPGKDPGLFSQAGLKPGDLAKSINGYDLTVSTQALELMGQLTELTEISVMVEREGQLIEIMFSLPQ